jgi:hypothetical protein
MVKSTIKAVIMIVKERPIESVSRPKTIGETAPAPNVMA